MTNQFTLLFEFQCCPNYKSKIPLAVEVWFVCFEFFLFIDPLGDTSWFATWCEPVDAARVAPANTAPTLVIDPRALILPLMLPTADEVKLTFRSFFCTSDDVHCWLSLLFIPVPIGEATEVASLFSFIEPLAEALNGERAFGTEVFRCAWAPVPGVTETVDPGHAPGITTWWISDIFFTTRVEAEVLPLGVDLSFRSWSVWKIRSNSSWKLVLQTNHLPCLMLLHLNRKSE